MTFIESIKKTLYRHPGIRSAVLFGSMASGKTTFNSDIDIAIGFNLPMTSFQKISIIEDLAALTGRPIDLVDILTVGEPLLGQILRKGTRILGDDLTHARLINRHLMDHADFMPLKNRILAERRQRWIGR